MLNDIWNGLVNDIENTKRRFDELEAASMATNEHSNDGLSAVLKSVDTLVLEPNGSNTVSGYLRSGSFPAFSGHLLWSPVNSHQLLETLVGVSFISLFVISWTCIM